MIPKRRIGIAEDHTILRAGLRMLVESNPDFEVVGEAQDGIEAIRMVENLHPELVLMDLSMPRMNGMGAIQEIKRLVPGTRVLVLTVHKTEEYILEALRSGADGYVLKDATQSELMHALECVLSGNSYLSSGISEQVIEGYLGTKRGMAASTSWERLTQREREILKMIAEGYRNKDIAECLCLSAKTVEKHRSNLMKKLDLHNISSLTAFAMEKGLVTQRIDRPQRGAEVGKPKIAARKE
jgi:DNA-binding NarL/FixJ family response regulator